MSEYAPTKRRGFFGSFLEFGTLSGYVLGNVIVLAVDLGIGPSTPAFQAWGWRIPFLIALPLGAIGLYLRLKLEDTPTFEALGRAGQAAKKAPFKEAITGHWRTILQLIGIVLLLNVADYSLLTFIPTYFSTQLHYSTTAATVIIIIVELVMMAVIAPVGALSDRIGRKPLLIAMAVGYIVLSYPAFTLMQQHSLPLLMVGYLIVALLS
jgi:MHS family proline/betaine transporter-like MFS transporter